VVSYQWINSSFLLNNFIISNCVVNDKYPRFDNRVLVKVFVSQGGEGIRRVEEVA
jgi:hypothetical protein